MLRSLAVPSSLRSSAAAQRERSAATDSVVRRAFRIASTSLVSFSPKSVRRAVHDLLCALRLRTDPGAWVLPGQVLACAYPRTEAALAALAAARVRVLVNLHARPHAPGALPGALARHGLAEVHLPTRDFAAPPLPALGRGVAAVEEALAAGHRVAVHCGGGRGRTGTLLACLLVARGEGPVAAIAQVRRVRPGAVETRAQEAAVRAFAHLVAGR
jgi:atypical dual specificity phosphatase